MAKKTTSKKTISKKATGKKTVNRKSGSDNSETVKTTNGEKMKPENLDLAVKQAFKEEWMIAHPGFTELSTDMFMAQTKQYIVCSRVIKRFLDPEIESAE